MSWIKQLKKQQSTGIYLSINIRGQTAQEIAINRYLSISINIRGQTAQEKAVNRYISIYQYQLKKYWSTGINLSVNIRGKTAVNRYLSINQYQGSNSSRNSSRNSLPAKIYLSFQQSNRPRNNNKQRFISFYQYQQIT